jgi:ribonuclease E
MLINGHRAEELRVAIIADGQLENFQIDIAEAGLRRGNIYRGVVASVQPSLNAAFVEFGAEKHGFLAGSDIVSQAYHRAPTDGGGRPRVEQVLERGKPILVQVTKDAMGTKGAALTTNLSLAGRYLVLTPYDAMRGLSRKVEDEAERKALKKKAQELTLPEGAGYIIRTNAADQPKASLNRDVNALMRLWKKVETEGVKGRGPKLLYSDQDLIIQVLRDYLDASIQSVLVDDVELRDRAEVFMKTFMPRSKVELTLYNERLPLFSQFGLEEQIDAISQRMVKLPSGGSIVIDPTEALTAIDVNSGKATRAANHEDTVYETNLEAAEEVARQLRLRDIGGLIVVDFIDMRSRRNQRTIEKTVKEAMKPDKARSTASRLSPNGLMEINRQRIKQALQLRTHRNCPTCKGTGMLASPENVGLSLLRRIEARAAAGTISAAKVRLHPELADAIQNHRRRELASLETEFDIHVDIFASSSLHRSDEEVQWIQRTGRSQRQPQPSQRSQSSRPKPKPAPAAASVTDLGSDSGSDLGSDSAPDSTRNNRETSGGEPKPSKSAKRRARKKRQGDRQKPNAQQATPQQDPRDQAPENDDRILKPYTTPQAHEETVSAAPAASAASAAPTASAAPAASAAPTAPDQKPDSEEKKPARKRRRRSGSRRRGRKKSTTTPSSSE